jgi:hypothetical protein
MKPTTLFVMVSVVLLIAGCKSEPAPAPAPTVATPAPAAPTTMPTAPADEQMAQTETPECTDCIPVNADNFVRAETDKTFAGIEKRGGFGKFRHFRETLPNEKQVVPRINMDTLYSVAVWDLNAGPVTITLPDAGKRFETMIAIDEDHYVHGVYYGKGVHTLTKQGIGTRYVLTAVRILVNSNDADDVNAVHALQDAIKVQQKSAGTLEFPKWDEASQDKTREALTSLGDQLPDLRHAFGTKGAVDPVRHLIATATAWGGNPDKDAIYLTVVPELNDGSTVQQLVVNKVPVDGFWSITVYDAKGYLDVNKFNSYSVNSVGAKRGTDGSVMVQFGGCDGVVPNCLPIMRGWNYTVRLYRPRPEIVSGKWKFPQAKTMQ